MKLLAYWVLDHTKAGTKPETRAGREPEPNPDVKPEVKVTHDPSAKAPPDLTRQIAKQAYAFYEQAGHRDGHADQDWLHAEEEIRKAKSPG